jgi:ActR/RegA family two-component response regulator
MPLPGRCVIACTLVLNYGVTNMAPTQSDQSLLLVEEEAPFLQTYKRSWKEQEFGHEPRWAPETKKPFASEVQRQFTAMLYL